MKLTEISRNHDDECDRCYGLGRKPSGGEDCPDCKGTGKCPKSLEEVFKRTDYVRCPDGQRHNYDWAGGFGAEGKTNRNVEKWKCSECGTTKTVFCDTKRRVNR